MGTLFASVYNRFLGKITEDMYMELTPQDTVRDLQKLLIDAIPNFEFPRKNLYDYTLKTDIIPESDVIPGDFILGVVWNELSEDDPNKPPEVIVEHSMFNIELTEEEINILALLMQGSWLQRQITSIENIRMKYSGSDFKFTSQANHMQKLLQLKKDYERTGFHLQRLYKRRTQDKNGIQRSTFGDIMGGSWRDY